MDPNETDINKSHELKEINRAGARAIAGPRQLDITRKGQEPDAKPYNKTGKSNAEYAKWGPNNKYPQELVDLNMADTTSSACLKFKISAHYGQGLYIYKTEVDAQGKEKKIPLSLFDPKYKEVRDFFERNDIENIQQAIITDYEWWNWYALELIPSSNNGDKKIASVNRVPVVNTRMGKQDGKTGKIDKIYVSGEFGGSVEPSNPDDIDVKTKSEIFAEGFKVTKKFAIIGKQFSVDRQYYPLPAWHSVNKFLNLSLEIADWILSNINNSINVKYHIKYPSGYWDKLCPVNAYDDETKRKAAIQKEMADHWKLLDDVLAGTSNVGKYFHSAQEVIGANGQTIGWEIVPIANQTNHDAYLPAFDTSAAAIANAHNAPLQLVGISLSKGMGAGSGSDIRESFNFYMQLHVEIPRQTTLEWLYLVKKINGWPDEVQFGYRNIILQSMNENKSGYAVENESTPTTNQK